MIYQVEGLSKVYKNKNSKIENRALKNISFNVEEGEFLAIMGESGSGKTTLLNILALLDRPSEGSVYLDGKNLNEVSDKNAAKFRRDNLGYVFQNYNLLDNFSVKDNILLPLVLREEDPQTMEAKLDPLASKLGLADKVNKFPYQISGGERQRVAVARALIGQPKIILADEPTGALDSASSDSLLENFVKINQEGQTILMVTHSIKAASFADRVVFLKDGDIFNQIYRGSRGQAQLYEEISNTMAQMAGTIR